MATENETPKPPGDELKLADEPVAEAPDNADSPRGERVWKLLVVDDEDEVHAVTSLALEDFHFAGRPLQLINAYSGEEARDIISEQPDIALILLDVVMETEQAGLDVAKYIRETLRNRFVRIILRTGQPGQAPEFKVITEFDINDYKEKTELTRQKLYTTVYTALSSYRDLMALEGNRRGLVKVIEASARIFEMRSVTRFAEGVLEQLTSLLYLEQDAIVIKASGLAAEKDDSSFSVVAAIGRFKDLVGGTIPDHIDPVVLKRVNNALLSRSNNYGADYFVGYYQTDFGTENILYVAAEEPISVPDIKLIELFARNVAIAHENVQRMSQQEK